MNTTAVAHATSGAATALWTWLQARWAARPQRRIQAATDQANAAMRDAAQELAAVRALADLYRTSDPSFASDLYAAADRYEREFDAAREASLRAAA